MPVVEIVDVVASACWRQSRCLRRWSVFQLVHRGYWEPQHPKFVGPRDENVGGIDLCRRIDRGSWHRYLERRWCKPCWLHERLSEFLESSNCCFGDKRTVSFQRSSSLRNFWRDLRGSLRRDFAVLPHGLGADGAWGKKLFILLLIELDDERFDPRSRSLRSSCATAFSLVKKEVPSRVVIFCLVEKIAR